jgi:hypothetical protein
MVNFLQSYMTVKQFAPLALNFCHFLSKPTKTININSKVGFKSLVKFLFVSVNADRMDISNCISYLHGKVVHWMFVKALLVDEKAVIVTNLILTLTSYSIGGPSVVKS